MGKYPKPIERFFLNLEVGSLSKSETSLIMNYFVVDLNLSLPKKAIIV